jgi:hypothetical protein
MVTMEIFPFKKKRHFRNGSRTRDLMISSQKIWPLGHEAGLNGVVSSSECGDPNNKMVEQWRVVKYVVQNDGDSV